MQKSTVRYQSTMQNHLESIKQSKNFTVELRTEFSKLNIRIFHRDAAEIKTNSIPDSLFSAMR